MTRSEAETDRLAALIDQKHDLLEQIRSLIGRQSELIQSGDTTRLLNVLAAKQQFLGHLQVVEKGLDPFRSDDPADRRWRSEAFRARVRQTAEENQQLLQQIMRLESECEAKLKHRRDDAASRLQGIHDSNAARAAYLADDGRRTSRLDLSSEV